MFSDKKLIMKYIIEIPESKIAFAEEFFKSISFIRNFTPIAPNEITNSSILKSIEDYESQNAISGEELKKRTTDFLISLDWKKYSSIK